MARWDKPTIDGALVTLRPLVAADTDAVWEMVRDPEGNDLTATTAEFEYEQIAAWCASRSDAADRLDLAIIERATREFAGEVVLNEFDAATNSANFRIALRGPAFYGRGLGGEATQLIVRHGLEVVGLERITLTVLARNPRAQRAYLAVGFIVTEEFEEDGEAWVEMAITAEQSPG
ncbi:MAG: GNAT family N-acetyltransferase [Ilumatobacteraceae bacterium]